MSQTHDAGFGLAGLLIVVLIVGILAAVATSLYNLGSVKSGAAPDATPGDTGLDAAKAAEAKMVAGMLWAGVQAGATSACGTPVMVHGSYARAGLTDSGATNPPRWSVSSGDASLVADCSTGAYTASNPILFTVEGTAADVAAIRVQLYYDAKGAPPSRLLCSSNRGAMFADC